LATLAGVQLSPSLNPAELVDDTFNRFIAKPDVAEFVGKVEDAEFYTRTGVPRRILQGGLGVEASCIRHTIVVLQPNDLALSVEKGGNRKTSMEIRAALNEGVALNWDVRSAQ
jgi:hypothetical protein